MNKCIYILLFLFVWKVTFSQHTRRIGLFAPLYLDSVFHGTDYNYGKKFPRFALQGIDFVQGTQLAIDSFPINNCIIDLSIYDSKADSPAVAALIQSGQLDSLQLIIGAVKDNELTELAIFAKNKNIPFVSATYPNDAGITNNPYFIITNSTLKTHCEGIFSYLLQNNSSDNIIHVRQTGTQEDRVAGYFNTINKPDKKPLLSFKTMTLDSNYALLKTSLDSTKKNIIFCGSLDEEFANAITAVLNPVRKKYDLMLIGMPNWETFAGFGKNNKESMKDFPVYYTSPYFNTKTDNMSIEIQDAYLKNYKGKPSDFAYKGFETMYLFSRLINLFPNNMIEHLNDHSFTVFSDFNFMAMKRQVDSPTINYYENKHLFFLKKMNGIITKGW